MEVQWSPSIADTTGTKDFVLYSEVFLAQGVTVDHAPLTIMASYAGARLWTMKCSCIDKRSIDIKIFGIGQESRTYLGYIDGIRRLLILTSVWLSVHYARSFDIAQAQMGLMGLWSSKVDAES